MSYAAGRPILDADSHLMELPGFLDPFIEASMVERLKGRVPPPRVIARRRPPPSPACTDSRCRR